MSYITGLDVLLKRLYLFHNITNSTLVFQAAKICVVSLMSKYI